MVDPIPETPPQRPSHPTNRPGTFHTSIGIQLTWTCDIACTFCGTWSSPRERRTIVPDALERVVADLAAARPRVRHVEVTGGEVFAVPETLLHCARLLARAEIPYTVITNASWATDADTARTRLAELPGLIRVVVSRDVYHARYVDEAHVCRALEAARDRGCEGFLTYAYTRDERPGLHLFGEELRRLVTTELLIGHTFCPIFDAGRARERCLDEVPDSEIEGPCHMLQQMMVTPEGDYYACCFGGTLIRGGMPMLRLGNAAVESEGAMHERALEDPVVVALATRGPADVLRALGEEVVPGEHRCICSVCRHLQGVTRVRERIVAHYAAPTARATLRDEFARLYSIDSPA